MSNKQEAPSPGKSLEGQQFQLNDPEERQRVIELAFDYRGDVTITLQSGQTIEGYVFDRNPASPSPTLKIFPIGQVGPLVLQYEELVTLTFSGRRYRLWKILG